MIISFIILFHSISDNFVQLYMCFQLMQNITGTTVSQNVVIAMSGISKVFVGEVIETGSFYCATLTETCESLICQFSVNLLWSCSKCFAFFFFFFFEGGGGESSKFMDNVLSKNHTFYSICFVCRHHLGRSF